MRSIKPSELGDLISCEVCFMEIPVSEAKNEEATEYVVYFCGLDCYDKWKNQSENKENN